MGRGLPPSHEAALTAQASTHRQPSMCAQDNRRCRGEETGLSANKPSEPQGPAAGCISMLNHHLMDFVC